MRITTPITHAIPSPMPHRIHILGPSGAGTTTLGESLADRLNITHLDTDAFYWMPTAIPFTQKRPVPDRLAMLRDACSNDDQWVLSGSLCSWGDPLVPMFTHVVFLYIPWDVRKQRLTLREHQRYGAGSLLPGGEMHDIHAAFMQWASRYDHAGLEQRSYTTHEHWLNQLPDKCQTLRIEHPLPLDTLTDQVEQWIKTTT